MHRQPERLHARAHLRQESLDIVQSLETAYAAVGASNNNHVATGVAGSPLLRPQVYRASRAACASACLAAPMMNSCSQPSRKAYESAFGQHAKWHCEALGYGYNSDRNQILETVAASGAVHTFATAS
jgi:hypothetical protein